MASQRPADLGGDSGWVTHVYAWLAIGIAASIFVFVIVFLLAYHSGRASAQREALEGFQRVAAHERAKFRRGDLVVILVGRIEGQIVSVRYNSEGGAQYRVKYLKAYAVSAGNRWVPASLHPEYGWFEEFELCRPQDAPPPPDALAGPQSAE